MITSFIIHNSIGKSRVNTRPPIDLLMLRFIRSRVLQSVFALFVIITVTFFLLRFVPGGPFTAEKAVPKEILRNLEESELTPEGTVRQPTRRQQDRDKLKQLAPPPQMDLFG